MVRTHTPSHKHATGHHAEVTRHITTPNTAGHGSWRGGTSQKPNGAQAMSWVLGSRTALSTRHVTPSVTSKGTNTHWFTSADARPTRWLPERTSTTSMRTLEGGTWHWACGDAASVHDHLHQTPEVGMGWVGGGQRGVHVWRGGQPH